MDVSPISAIGPVREVRPRLAAPDLSRVFEVEYLGQANDEEYAPSDRDQGRGMEDEEADSVGSPDPEVEVARNVDGPSSVSWFA